MVDVKWMVNEMIALTDAYSEKMVQEITKGIASNKELHEQLQQIMKEQSNVNRTPQQTETKLRAPWCLNNNFLLVPGHSVLARVPSLDTAEFSSRHDVCACNKGENGHNMSKHRSVVLCS